MTQKFYLHDAATTVGGTLPAGEQSTATSVLTITGASTNRSMDGIAGTSPVSATWNSGANTSPQASLVRMFVSKPLAAQTIAAGTWTAGLGGVEGNAASNLEFSFVVYVWRPGTGAIVGSRIFDINLITAEPGTSATWVTASTASSGSVTVLDGDVLVVEVWRDGTIQGMGTAYSNEFDYDGTTETSTTSPASFINAPADIPLYVPPITQAAYRVYADGTESGSTALAAQNTAYTADISGGDVNLLVRVLMQSTSAVMALPATDDWQLQWEKNASGTWVDVAWSVIDTYPVSNFASTTYPLSTTTTEVVQSFRGDGRVLSRVVFYLAQINSPTGTLIAVLYAHTGTFGSGGLPTGSALATSLNSVNVSALPVGVAAFPFDFDETFTLVNGTAYFIGLRDSGAAAPPNSSLVAADSTSPTHAGNLAAFTTSWAADSTRDLIFEVRAPPPATLVPYDSANLTDGAATTNRLTSGTGTFTAGEVSEDGLVDDVGFAGNNFTELLYAITLKAAALANGDTLRFRVQRNGATTGLTYTQTPTIPITSGAAAAALAALKYRDQPSRHHRRARARYGG